MNNQEYLDRMLLEERQRSQIEGIAGIVKLQADLIENGSIIVDPDSLKDDGRSFSFEYRKS